MTATTLAGHLQEARAALTKRRVGGMIARTACSSAGTAATLSGVIEARTVGPTGLAPGRVWLSLAGPLTRYGLAQLAAVTPTAVNDYPDQLVLFQLVPRADLGRYAIAASVTMVSVPLVWILTPGGNFLACGQFVGDLLRGVNRPGLVALAQGLAAIGTVTLLIVLLPSCGVAAAAIASTVAYGTALAAMLRWLRRPPRRRERARGAPGRPGTAGRRPPDH